MSQSPQKQQLITSYFTSRKRACNDNDVYHTKSKRPRVVSYNSKTVAKPNDAPLEDKKIYNNTEVTTSARKELGLGDLRKRLAASSKLDEFRARADRLTKKIEALKHGSGKPNLKDFQSIEVEVPVSPRKKALMVNEFVSPKKEDSPISKQVPLISPRKVFVSPVKSPAKISAYTKQAHSFREGLPLPHRYKFLVEVFRSMETVVSLSYNRNEKISFAKLKSSLQEMLKRNFTEKHLAQIKNLVPDFYTYEVQTKKNSFNNGQTKSCDLVITPNFPNGITVMTPNIIVERQRYFIDALMKVVKKHHAKFLLSLETPMVISDEKLSRWHPEFDLENVPEVECAKLPDVSGGADNISTAQDVLSRARQLLKCNSRMTRALENIAADRAKLVNKSEAIATKDTVKDKDNHAKTTQTETPTSQVTLLNPALRNLPAALLEKVKAKQAAKALESMTRSSEQDKKYMIYSRLPDLARTLRNIFVTERKNVLALNIVLSKLGSSFKANISASDFQRDIDVLSKEIPNFISYHKKDDDNYLRLDRTYNLNAIVNRLETLADNYRSG